jgi:hypothetical protein
MIANPLPGGTESDKRSSPVYSQDSLQMCAF